MDNITNLAGGMEHTAEDCDSSSFRLRSTEELQLLSCPATHEAGEKVLMNARESSLSGGALCWKAAVFPGFVCSS